MSGKTNPEMIHIFSILAALGVWGWIALDVALADHAQCDVGQTKNSRIIQ